MKKIKFKLPKIKLKIFNAYAIATISITFVLIFIGIILLIIFNGKRLINKAKENVQLIVIIKPSVNESEILLFQKELDHKTFVKATDYISKDQALEEMKTYLGSDIVDLLDYNPLPPIINIYLKAGFTEQEEIDKIIKYLLDQAIVDDVFYNTSLIYQLNQNINIISTILGVITFLFILISLALINNTIRLVIFSKRQEIKTMQLVGASDWFILKPFLINSTLQGLFAGLIAATVIVLSLVYIRLKSNNILEIYNLELTIALIFIIGILITSLSTYFAVKHFLWASDEQIWT